MCVIARTHMWFKEARHVALQAVTAGNSWSSVLQGV
jgi:hypothetical protein